MRPKLIAAVLVGGIAALGGGSAVAASLPSWTTHTAATAPSTARAMGPGTASASPVTPSSPTAEPSRTVPAPARASTPGTPAAGTDPRPTKSAAAPSVTYTVKRGDTLSGIAEWFKLHGYGTLYAANTAVIGANPNLILPGERITIANGVMTFSSAR